MKTASESKLKIDSITIRDLVHIIRGQQVILDSDLAALYQVETGALNRAVKRNQKRFPSDFCFRLEPEEFLICQNGISKSNGQDSRGGRRHLPYAFTEQGISMLSAVLHSEVAIEVSIGIMRAFIEMRRFLNTNSLILHRVNELEAKQLEYQKSVNGRLDKVFQYIQDHAESEQKIFFDGQIYDAFSLIVSIIQKARQRIVLIDNYVDVDTLNVLAKKRTHANVEIYTYANTSLTKTDVINFNAQYPILTIKKTQIFHDRFIILDDKVAYHLGASVKDAGKKCFGITLLRDETMVANILAKL